MSAEEVASSTSGPLADADLVLAFVNTRSIVGSPEHLDDAEAMTDWLAERGFVDLDGGVSEADVVYARELRQAVVCLMLEHVGIGSADSAETGRAEAYLARAAFLHPVAPLIRAHSSAWAPTQTGVAGFVGTLLAAVARTTEDGTWQRLKACKNHACYLGFLDRTKNSSGRYCSASCASQVASRAYRSRRSGSTTGS